MQIKSISIENILSIGSASIAFDANGLVLVEGWNFDADRANGAGKSAIFNSISFALYDKLPRKITASEILRRETKKGSVTLCFTCGSDDWSVIRKRPKEVKFYKNQIEQQITQTEFESLIGLNYDQFMMTIYGAQATSDGDKRFLSCSDTEKKAFLLKLLNLEKFDIYRKNSENKVKSVSLLMEASAQKLRTNLSKIEAYEESLIDEEQVRSEILSLQNKIAALSTKEVQLSAIEKPDTDKFYKLEEDLKNKLTLISRSKAQREIYYEQYKKTDSIQVNDECESCGGKIDETQLHEQHAVRRKNLDDIKLKLDQFDEIISKESELTDLLSKTRDKRKNISSDYLQAREQTLDLQKLISYATVQKENLDLKLKNNSNYLNKINDLRLEAEKAASAVDENKREIEFYKTVSSICSPTGAQAYVLDSIIDYFNESVQKYIQIVWPNVNYNLNSYKETAKGEVSAKFSEHLTMDGQQISIGSLSGGEHKALSLCIDFALLDVICNQFNININPIILDEPFDGLDSSGKEIVIGLLESISKDRQILVVDHASESKVLFSKVIRVEKKNGISTINIET